MVRHIEITLSVFALVFLAVSMDTANAAFGLNGTYHDLSSMPFATDAGTSGWMPYIGGKCYGFGGQTTNVSIMPWAFAYDVATDSYTILAEMPYGRMGIATIDLNDTDTILLTSGRNASKNPDNSTWLYSITADTYTVKQTINVTHPIYGDLYGPGAYSKGWHSNVTGYEELVYVTGGNGAPRYNQTVVYNITNDTWRLGPPMPIIGGRGRDNAAMGILNDTVIVTGGSGYYTPGGSQSFVNETHRFYYINESWESGLAAPSDINAGWLDEDDGIPRLSAEAVIDGKLHIWGGYLMDDTVYDKHMVYDPDADNWTEATPLAIPTARFAGTCNLGNGSVILFGGRRDPALGVWIDNATMFSLTDEASIPPAGQGTGGCNSSDWVYERNITITENSHGGDLFNYTINISFDTGSSISDGKLNPNGSDILFCYSNYSLYFYNETAINQSGNTTFWVNVPEIPNASTVTIQLKYGYPNATTRLTQANYDQVFIIYDGFDNETNNTNPSEWTFTKSGGTANVVVDDEQYNTYPHSVLLNYIGGNWGAINRSDTFNKTVGRVRFSVMIDENSTNKFMFLPYTPASPALLFSENASFRYLADNVMYYDFPNNQTIMNDTWYLIDIFFNATGTWSVYVNNSHAGAVTTRYFDAVNTTMYRSDGGDFWIDNFILMNWTSPEPTYTIGSEVGGIINLLSPANTTYNTNIIPLEVINDSDIDTWIYRIDDIAQNYTFTPNTTITINPDIVGTHNITIFANNSAGGTWYNITNRVFTIAYVEVDGEGRTTTAWETDSVTIWLDFEVYNWTAVENISVSSNLNGTVYNVSTHLGNNYSSSITVPNVDTETNLEIYWNYTVCYTSNDIFDGLCQSLNTTAYNLTVWEINLTSCTDGNITIEFSGYNETNETMNLMNFSMDIFIEIGLESEEYNFSFRNNHTYRLCIDPSNETYLADVDIEYWATGYATRHYFLRETTLTNETTVIDLYLLDSDNADEIQFTVYDRNYQEQTNVIIKAMRYFPGLNQYIVVDMGLTGTNGDTAMFLQSNRYYRWSAERDNEVLELTDTAVLSDTEIVIYLDVDPLAPFFEYYDRVAFNCTGDTDDHLIICSYVDTSGNMYSMRLTARRILLYNRSDAFCTDSSVSNADVLVCDYSAYENDTIYWELRGSFHGSGDEWPIWSNGWITITSSQLWGFDLQEGGILITLLLVLTMSMLGIYSPRVSIMFSTLGVVFAFLLGFFAVGIGFLIGFIAAAGLLIYRMR